MKEFRKPVILGSTTVLAASLLLAGSPAFVARASAQKTLTVAVAQNPTTMDPQDAQDTLSFSMQKPIYQGLLGFDSHMHVIDVLATGYQINKSATQITFELRKGVKFHDGTPFNAQAVKVNVDRVRNPANHLKRYSLYSMIKDVKVINDYKVQIDLKSPFGAIAANFAHPAGGMISPEALKRYGAQVSHHPDGTGPYVFDSWKDGDHLTVKANPHYWGAKPSVSQVTYKFVPDAASRIAMLQTNEAQFIYPVPSDQVAQLKSASNIKLEFNPSIIVNYIAMNVTKAPFNSVLVRQAINYAIDKNAFIKVTQNGYGTPSLSPIASNTWGYAAQSPYPYNVAKAKQLLAKAGYPNGFASTLVTDNSTESVKAVQFIQQQLAQVGITVQISTYDSPTLDTVVDVPPAQSKMQMYYTGWSPSTGDADWGLRPLLSTGGFPPTGYNISFYSNPKVDGLIADALKTGDPAKRKKFYAEVQKTVVQDAAWGFLNVPDVIFAYRNNVSGAYVLPDGSISINNAVIH